MAITPLFLRDDNRIRGLLVLLGIALRLLTLKVALRGAIEFVVRRELATTARDTPLRGCGPLGGHEPLKGLYAGNPNRATDRPTTERLLKAFDDITLYQFTSATGIRSEVTELSPLQRRILQKWPFEGPLMQVPESVYAAPAQLIDTG